MVKLIKEYCLDNNINFSLLTKKDIQNIGEYIGYYYGR